MARVIVTGSRAWYCPELARATVSRLLARHPHGLVIVHGHCPSGVDRAFDEAATAAGVEVERHPADWDAHGKAAGPLRNEAMVRAGADLCVAVSRDLATSRGTRHCAGEAIRAGIPTCLIGDEGGEPRWITEI